MVVNVEIDGLARRKIEIDAVAERKAQAFFANVEGAERISTDDLRLVRRDRIGGASDQDDAGRDQRSMPGSANAGAARRGPGQRRRLRCARQSSARIAQRSWSRQRPAIF